MVLYASTYTGRVYCLAIRSDSIENYASCWSVNCKSNLTQPKTVIVRPTELIDQTVLRSLPLPVTYEAFYFQYILPRQDIPLATVETLSRLRPNEMPPTAVRL